MEAQALTTRRTEPLDQRRMVANRSYRPIYAAPVEIRERDGGFVVTMDIPGATRRSTDVTLLDERTLSVRARSTDPSRGDTADWGAIIKLPDRVDPDAVQPSVAEGVVMVKLARLDGGRHRVQAAASN